MKQSRELIESIVKENKVWIFAEDCQNSVFAQVVYGITTGFGKFARTVIEKDKLAELQVNEKKHLTILFSTAMHVLVCSVSRKSNFGLYDDVVNPSWTPYILQANLIRSHAAGVGRALSPENTR